MLPTEGRDVRQEFGIRRLTGGCAVGDDLAGLVGVPVNDGGGDEVEAGHAVVLAFGGPVTDFAASSEGNGALEGVMGLALIDAELCAALEVGVGDPSQEEQGAFDASHLAQRHGEFVGARTGGKPPQDGGGLNGAERH